MKGKNVLVTGAGGFIGSHLAERLVLAGANVRAMVRYNGAGTCGWLDSSPLGKEMEIFPGDIRDPDLVRQASRGREVVFHLAAMIAIPYSYQAPESYVQANIVGTLNVLQAVRDLGVSRLVHTSTSEVYGTARYVPISESHPLQTQSPYAATKLAADKLLESYQCAFGTPTVTVRPFNTFGPRQSARAIIPTIISQCLAGASVRLGSLHPKRDLNFVADTVDGFLKAAVAPDAIGGVFNLGSGKEMSIGELAQLIARLMRRDIVIETDPIRVRPQGSEVERLIADARLAHDVLGWRPEVSLEDGLKQTIDWVEKNAGRYRSDLYSR